MPLNSKNYFGQALIELFTQLKTEVPELVWIAEDIGQLDEAELRPEVDFPCALIDFPQTSFESISESNQLGLPTITIKLAHNTYSEAYSAAPDASVEASLQRFEIEQKVIEALHGWGVADLFQPLTLTNATGDKRNDGLKVRTLTFTTALEFFKERLGERRTVSLKINTGIV